jgi:hypothetical protein
MVQQRCALKHAARLSAHSHAAPRQNNGHNEWDQKDRYTENPSNYYIGAPGRYRLKSGRVERLSD